MMNRLMTVKLLLCKTEKTVSRQATSMRRQISFSNRRKQLSVFWHYLLAELNVHLFIDCLWSNFQ